MPVGKNCDTLRHIMFPRRRVIVASFPLRVCTFKPGMNALKATAWIDSPGILHFTSYQLSLTSVGMYT